MQSVTPKRGKSVPCGRLRMRTGPAKVRCATTRKKTARPDCEDGGPTRVYKQWSRQDLDLQEVPIGLYMQSFVNCQTNFTTGP